MQTEYRNRKTSSRIKLAKKLGATLVLLIFSIFLKYLLSPENAQKGITSSRYTLSWENFLIYSLAATMIFIIVTFWSRIIISINISMETKSLTVQFIDRFCWTSKIKTAKLSETQIQIEHYEKTNYWLLKKAPESFALHLTAPNFRIITVTSTDFDNISDIVQTFDQLKVNDASETRLRRLGKIKRPATNTGP